MSPALFFLFLLTISSSFSKSVKNNDTRDQVTIDIELFYSANSQLDGDYVLSQLSVELHDDPQYPNLAIFTLSVGPGVTITGETGNYSCTDAGDHICETSLLHYCVLEHYMPEQVTFLECYFQSELFPFDLLGASRQCAETAFNENAWQLLSGCAGEPTTLAAYAEAVIRAQALRPPIRQTPYVLIDEAYSCLAAVDLRKALCRSQSAPGEDDYWQCESVDKFKEPKVEVFYRPYGDEAAAFFGRFSQAEDDLLQSAASLLSILPNPNGVLGCQPAQESCFIHKAHWCAHDSSAVELHQLDFIHCTFQNASSSLKPAEDLVKACLPEGQYEEFIKPCIDDIDSSTTKLQLYQAQLNSLVDPLLQTSLEIVIQDQSSVKAKDGLLEELCNNYFETDNENLGCQVKRPRVQIFYESPSASFDAVLLQHLKQFDQFSPFDQLMELELVPYGLTTVGQDGAYICGSGGADSCTVNWLQACLLKERWSSSAGDQYQVLQFIACSSSAEPSDNLVGTAKDCLLKVYPDEGTWLWNTIDNCASNDTALKEQLRNKTEAIDLKQVPEIVVNEQKKTTEAGSSLLVYLCQSAFSPIKPKACFEIDSTESGTFVLPVSVFLHGDMDTHVWVQTQLRPLFQDNQQQQQQVRLRDVIDWHFVPWGPSSYNASSGEISCAGGPKECLVNRVLACATMQRQNGQLGRRADRQRVAAFLVCFFDWGSNWLADPLTVAGGCSGHLSKLDSYPQLWQCSLQQGREKVMLAMKSATEAYPNIGRWPAVAIGGEVLFGDTSLTAVLCAHYKASPRPVECVQLETSTVAPTTTADPGSSATAVFSAAALTSVWVFTFSSLLLYSSSL